MSNRVIKVKPGSPAPVDYTHWRNDTFTDEFTGYNKDGTPYDFTNHTFKLQLRKDKTQTTPDVDITDASFTITQDAAGVTAGVNNVIEIEHTSADFDLVGCYYYDLQMEDAASKRQTIQSGTFDIIQDATR